MLLTYDSLTANGWPMVLEVFAQRKNKTEQRSAKALAVHV